MISLLNILKNGHLTLFVDVRVLDHPRVVYHLRVMQALRVVDQVRVMHH